MILSMASKSTMCDITSQHIRIKAKEKVNTSQYSTIQYSTVQYPLQPHYMPASNRAGQSSIGWNSKTATETAAEAEAEAEIADKSVQWVRL